LLGQGLQLGIGAPALSTALTSDSSALRRPASLASSCARAASFRLRMRPKKSASQLLICRPAVKVLVCAPLVLGARLAVRPTPTVGQRSASLAPNWARARSTLSMATRKSRLLRRACSTRLRRAGSCTNSCHVSGWALVAVPGTSDAAAGSCAGTGAAGRS